MFTLKKGARVSVTAVRGSVAKVRYNGKTGYLLTSSLSLSAAKAQKKVYATTAVYRVADAGSKQIGKLSAGDYVDVIAVKGDWAKVRREGSEGFIPKRALEKTEAKTVEAAREKAMTTTVAAKLFAKASQGSAYKKVSAGTKVTVLDEKGSWYKVSKSGTTGFMLKKAFAAVAAKPARPQKPTKRSKPAPPARRC